jgi:hypothetical protein
MRAAALAIFSFLYVSGAHAQEQVCGEPMIVADESLKGTIKGKAEFLTRYFGNAELDGQVETARTDIFSRYPHAEKGRATAYFQYVLCALLFSDQSLTQQEKIDQWMRIEYVLQSEPKRSQPGAAGSKVTSPESNSTSNNKQISNGKCSPNVIDMNGNIIIKSCD